VIVARAGGTGLEAWPSLGSGVSGEVLADR